MAEQQEVVELEGAAPEVVAAGEDLAVIPAEEGLSDVVQRMLRTGIQSLIALAASGGFTALWNALATEYQIPVWAALLFTITVGPTIVSFGQNYLEDQGKIKTRLKTPATEAAIKKTTGLPVQR